MSRSARHRRYTVVRQQLADYKEVKGRALGGTVNDVVLTVVSGAPRSMAAFREGSGTEGLEMRALRASVRFASRTSPTRSATNSRLMRGPLPVYIKDPVARPEVRKASNGRSQGLEAGRRRGDPRPREQPCPAHGSWRRRPRLNFSTRLFNLIVTNIPRTAAAAITCWAGKLEDLFPIAFLPRPPTRSSRSRFMSY